MPTIVLERTFKVDSQSTFLLYNYFYLQNILMWGEIKMKISISDSYIADDINAELEELVCVTGKDKQEIICDSLNFYADYYRKIMRGEVKCML